MRGRMYRFALSAQLEAFAPVACRADRGAQDLLHTIGFDCGGALFSAGGAADTRNRRRLGQLARLHLYLAWRGLLAGWALVEKSIGTGSMTSTLFIAGTDTGIGKTHAACIWIY